VSVQGKSLQTQIVELWNRQTQQATTSLTVGESMFAAAAKTIPVDADTFAINDSADSNKLKKLSWLNLKTAMQTFLDPVYVLKAGDTMTGTLTATKLIPSGNVTAGNGMYLPAVNALAFSTDGIEAIRVNASQDVRIGSSGTLVSGLLVSRATGSATPTPVEMRLQSTTNASDFSLTDPWSRLSFYSSDSSGGGPKIHASIDAVMRQVQGTASILKFNVSNINNATLSTALEIFDNTGVNAMAVYPGTDNAQQLGLSNRRWGTIHTGSITIGTGANNRATIAYTTNTARTYTIPNAGANADFVMSEGTQTINGPKTFGSVVVIPDATAATHAVNRQFGDGRYPRLTSANDFTNTNTVSGTLNVSGTMQFGGSTGQAWTVRLIDADANQYDVVFTKGGLTSVTPV
jgi:hypothetical protein